MSGFRPGFSTQIIGPNQFEYPQGGDKPTLRDLATRGYMSAKLQSNMPSTSEGDSHDVPAPNLRNTERGSKRLNGR